MKELRSGSQSNVLNYQSKSQKTTKSESRKNKIKLTNLYNYKFTTKLQKRYRFGDDGAPAFIEGPLHDSVIGAGRTRPDHERVRHLQPIHRHTKIRLRRLSLRINSEPDPVPATRRPTRPNRREIGHRSADPGSKSERFHWVCVCVR